MGEVKRYHRMVAATSGSPPDTQGVQAHTHVSFDLLQLLTATHCAPSDGSIFINNIISMIFAGDMQGKYKGYSLESPLPRTEDHRGWSFSLILLLWVSLPTGMGLVLTPQPKVL